MTRSQIAVAAVAVLAALACVAGIYYAGHEIYRTIGPSKAVAAADGNLYLVSHGKIHVFGPDGKRRSAYDLDSLGASLTPSDLAVHRDGRVVVASPDGSNLRRCTLPAGPCDTLDPNLTGVPLQHALPLNSVKIAIDEDRGRYFLSDNAGHRIVETDFAAKRIAATKANVVWYPNQLAFESPGRLRVVDTNHQRIATFSVVGDGIGPLLAAMPTAADGVARSGREWPFDAVRMPSGETWALVAVEGMKDADLVVYDATGIARKRIDLGDDSDPFDIELWRNRVVVSDATNYRVESVGLDGRRMSAFDDPEFSSELAAARERPEWWRMARLAATVGIVAIPLFAIVVLRLMGAPMGLKLQGPVPLLSRVDAARLEDDVRWVAVSPRFPELMRKKMKKAGVLYALVLIAALVMSGLVFGPSVLHDPKFQRLVVSFGLTLVVTVLILVFGMQKAGKQFEGYRIGASRTGVRYELPKSMAPFGMQREGRAPWREVFHDGRRLLVGRKMLMLRTPHGTPIFEEEELRQVVLANVPAANVVSSDKLLIKQVGGPWVLLFLAAVVAVMIWLFTRTL